MNEQELENVFKTFKLMDRRSEHVLETEETRYLKYKECELN